MAQDMIRKGPELPIDQRMSHAQHLEDSIGAMTSKLNFFARWSTHVKSGKHMAVAIVEMRKEVTAAQHSVVRTYANLIAREQNIQLTDHFQERISDVTKRVDERTAQETKYYWAKLDERRDYYEDFFQERIRKIETKVASGEMTKERGDARIKEYETERVEQMEQDKLIISELRDASFKIVRRALQEYHPD